MASLNRSKPRLRAPRGLSAEAARRWREQVDELEARRRLTPSLRELVESWARALDARDTALMAWEDAGRPETDAGSTGQQR